MDIIDHYLYTKEHEWVSIEDNVATMGITDFAQNALGDITYVELPEEDSEVEQFEQCITVESVKAASDVFAVMSGRVIDVNRKLENDPSIINKDCFHKGWIIKVEVRDMDETTNLMSAEEYSQYVESLNH